MSTNLQLFNHVTEDTAFVIQRFPYSFGHYTMIRYWVETKPAYGQRLMTQIMNPANGAWFKAKTDGYKDVVILEQIVDESQRNCGLVVNYQLDLDKLPLEHLLQFAAHYEFTPFQKQQIVKALAAKSHHRMPAWKPTTSLDYELNKRVEHKPEEWQYAVRTTDETGITIESAHDAHQRMKREERQQRPSQQLSRAQAPNADDDDTAGMSWQEVARYNSAMDREPTHGMSPQQLIEYNNAIGSN